MTEVHECRLVPLFVGPRARGSIGGFSVVDAADWDDVSQFDWRLHRGGYAMRAVGKRNQLLHRRVMGCADGDGTVVDHINRNGLDNRRSNLRVCTIAENAQNQGVRRVAGKSSRYRGVTRDHHRWIATAIIGGTLYHLGRYSSEDEAAHAAADFRREHMPFAVEDPVASGASILPRRAWVLERMRWLGEVQ